MELLQRPSQEFLIRSLEFSPKCNGDQEFRVHALCDADRIPTVQQSHTFLCLLIMALPLSEAGGFHDIVMAIRHVPLAPQGE
eukprot:15330837-Ditylum_brightwellii.AAC.1